MDTIEDQTIHEPRKVIPWGYITLGFMAGTLLTITFATNNPLQSFALTTLAAKTKTWRDIGSPSAGRHAGKLAEEAAGVAKYNAEQAAKSAGLPAPTNTRPCTGSEVCGLKDVYNPNSPTGRVGAPAGNGDISGYYRIGERYYPIGESAGGPTNAQLTANKIQVSLQNALAAAVSGTTPGVTQAPTAHPSAGATRIPTQVPSGQPSVKPSAQPTSANVAPTSHSSATTITANNFPASVLTDLTPKGRSMLELYNWYSQQNDAWWMKETGGKFTPADFLAVILQAEATGNKPETLKAIATATTNQLWSVGNPSAPKGDSSYCTSSDCTAGIMNFLGNYSGSAWLRYTAAIGDPTSSSLKGLKDPLTSGMFANSGLSLEQIAELTVYNPDPTATVWSNDKPIHWGCIGSGCDPYLTERAANAPICDDIGCVYYRESGEVVYSANQASILDK